MGGPWFLWFEQIILGRIGPDLPAFGGTAWLFSFAGDTRRHQATLSVVSPGGANLILLATTCDRLR